MVPQRKHFTTPRCSVSWESRPIIGSLATTLFPPGERADDGRAFPFAFACWLLSLLVTRVLLLHLFGSAHGVHARFDPQVYGESQLLQQIRINAIFYLHLLDRDNSFHLTPCRKAVSGGGLLTLFVEGCQLTPRRPSTRRAACAPLCLVASPTAFAVDARDLSGSLRPSYLGRSKKRRSRARARGPIVSYHLSVGSNGALTQLVFIFGSDILL